MQTGIRYGLMLGEQPTELLPGDILCFDLEHKTAAITRGGRPLEPNRSDDSKMYLDFDLNSMVCLDIALLVARSHGYDIEVVLKDNLRALFRFCITDFE